MLQVDHQVGDGVTRLSEDLLERTVRERRLGPLEPPALGAVGHHQIVDALGERQHGVHREDPGDPAGITQCEPGADGAAPVTDHQGDVREVERVDEQRFEIQEPSSAGSFLRRAAWYALNVMSSTSRPPSRRRGPARPDQAGPASSGWLCTEQSEIWAVLY
jgi:hypothetical protein